MIYNLIKPVEFDGEMIESLDLKFDELFYDDLMKCEKESDIRLSKSETSVQPEMNTTYLLCVAAQAAGVMTELILSLKVKDIIVIKSLVQKFLLSDKPNFDEQTCKYRLIHPVNFKNELIEELIFDFDELSFEDLRQCEKESRKELRKRNKVLITPEFDTIYLLYIAAKASNVEPNLLKGLRADDFTNIKMFTQSFLLSGALEVED